MYPANHITYTCNIKGCGNEKTVPKSAYKRSVSHYCSNKCSQLGRSGARKTHIVDTLKLDRLKKIKNQIDEYFHVG